MMKIACLFILIVTLLSQPGFSAPKKKSIHHIRVLIIIDYNLYFQSWQRTLDDNITCYYSTIFKGVAKRFKTVKGSNFKFQLSDIIVLKEYKDGRIIKFQPNYFGKLQEKIVIITSTKASFEEWERKNRERLKNKVYNVVLIYTRGRAGTYGLTSTFQSFCKQQRIIMQITDKGLFNTIDATAHALGYSLGAPRDGYNNDCQANDHYIMTYKRLQVDGSFHDNRLKFSNCSVKSINKYLTNLEDKKFCSANKNSKTIQSKCGIKNAGINFALEEQCKLAIGWYSEPCMNNFMTEDGVCKELRCYSRSTSSCKEVFPVEATSCGINKWCQDGKCKKRTKISIDLKNIKERWDIHEKKMSQGLTSNPCVNNELTTCLDFCINKTDCKAVNYNPFGIRLVISKIDLEIRIINKEGMMTFVKKKNVNKIINY